MITVFGHEFECNPPWGIVHDKEAPRANCWYDKSAVSINGESVKLHIHFNPKDFILDQGDNAPLVIHADYGVGMLWSVNSFSFGKYTLIAKLPKGNYLWPAFWLYTATPHRPEEIDIFEAYSKETGYKVMGGICKKSFKGWDIRNCLHTGTSDFKLKKMPAIYPDLNTFNTDPCSDYLKYEFVWYPEIMVFSINNTIIRVIYDTNILNHFSQYNQMNVVINNHIDGRYYKQFSLNGITPFEIVNFFYLPHKTEKP